MFKTREQINLNESSASRDGLNDTSDVYLPKKSSRNGVLAFSATLFIGSIAMSMAVVWAVLGRITPWTLLVALAVGVLVTSCTHIALSWEKIVIVRLGKVHRVAGPGLYFTIPLIEYATIRVDERVITTPFYADETLTCDMAPINIDAVLFWMVRDARAACTEVEDYYSAISLLAQTALREAVGRSSAAEVAIRRDELDVEIQRDIERQASEWGIDIIAVKVRDIRISEPLRDAMSFEAQADRERNARLLVAGAEVEMAELLTQAAEIYGDPNAALKLRTMLQQYDAIKHSKSTIVSLPTTLSDVLEHTKNTSSEL